MISSMMHALMAPDSVEHGSIKSTDGDAFLAVLFDSLPPEIQGLSMPELLDWLREQGEQAVIDMPWQPLPQAQGVLPYSSAMDEAESLGDFSSKQESSQGLLGLIVNSREQLNVQQVEEGEVGQPVQLDPDRQAPTTQGPASEAPFQVLLARQPDAPGELKAQAEAPLPVPVRHPEFGQAVGERLTWLVRNEVHEATLRLDPPNLGPLEISISVKDDQASIQIQAHHALTREVLEAEAPRLRGLLGEAGFAQVDVDVARDQAGEGGERNSGHRDAAAEPVTNETPVTDTQDVDVRRATGLIDQYV